MTNKQILGLVIAGVLFITTGVTSVFSQNMAEQMLAGSSTFTGILGQMYGTSNSVTLPEENFIGIVRVEGTIQDTGSSSAFTSVSYDHYGILRYIDKMMSSDYNKGILLVINSPGGTVYHSDELYLKLMEYKQETGRPIHAYMEQEACSGGYYIAMAADKISANRNAWTGSIGVRISYYNYSELMDNLGVEEIHITSGENKAMGSSGTPLTEEQKDIFQSLVDESYEQFLEIVADGRKMTEAQVRPLADGRIYTAKQAQEVQLIDTVEDYSEFELAFRKEVGGGSVIYEPYFGATGIFTSLMSAYGKKQNKSDGQLLSEFLEKEGNGVPLYYAGN